VLSPQLSNCTPMRSMSDSQRLQIRVLGGHRQTSVAPGEHVPWPPGRPVGAPV
jgi:hypothetical protein